MMIKNPQSGNAVVMILVGVALFAALAYTIMKGSQQGQGNLTANQARIAAQEIMSYAQSVNKGVNKLRSRGCSESQLNFENELVIPPTPSQTNPSAPVSHECDLFHLSGAGLKVLKPKDSWFAATNVGDIFWYTGSEAYTGFGTTCTNASCGDLAINLWDIPKNLCEAINTLAGHNFSTIPTSSALCWGQYTGAFTCGGSGTVRVVFTQPDLVGKETVCLRDPSNGYVFNHIILAR